MLSRQAFVTLFNEVWALRHDLPDGMDSALKEVLEEARFTPKEADYTDLAEWVNDILEEEGFPSVFELEGGGHE